MCVASVLGASRGPSCERRGEALEVYPNSPAGLSAAVRAFAYPDATEPPVPSRIPSQDIDGLLAYLPARKTHGSLAALPSVSTPCRATVRQGQVLSLQAALKGPTETPLCPPRSIP